MLGWPLVLIVLVDLQCLYCWLTIDAYSIGWPSVFVLLAYLWCLQCWLTLEVCSVGWLLTFVCSLFQDPKATESGGHSSASHGWKYWVFCKSVCAFQTLYSLWYPPFIQEERFIVIAPLLDGTYRYHLQDVTCRMSLIDATGRMSPIDVTCRMSLVGCHFLNVTFVMQDVTYWLLDTIFGMSVVRCHLRMPLARCWVSLNGF